MRNNFSRLPNLRSACIALCGASLILTCVAFIGQSARAASPAADNADQPVVAVQTVQVQRGTIAQPVRAYGVVAASASNLTTINLPYVARIVQMRVQPGQAVKRGAALFVVQADPAAVLAATQARSAVTLAQGELTRTQSLLNQGLATQSQLAAARKAADDAKEALAAQNESGVAAGNKTVTAPADGVVLQISAAQGDQVQAGAAILQLAGANDRGVRANVMLGVEPADAVAIHAGDTVTLRGLSTSLAKTPANGRVTLVGASVDPQSQLVDVGAIVPLAQTAFIPGTHVSADIATHSGTHWIVPRAAVLKDEKGAYLFQITPQNKAHRVNVVIQVENANRYGVEGPVEAAQGLVTSGNYELKDGMQVRTSGGASQ